MNAVGFARCTYWIWSWSLTGFITWRTKVHGWQFSTTKEFGRQRCHRR